MKRMCIVLGCSWACFGACVSGPAPSATTAPASEKDVDPLLGDLEYEEEDLEEEAGREDDTGESDADGSDEDKVSSAIFALPEYTERIDIDRFLSDRRALMVKYMPLQPKYDEIHRSFAPGLVIERQAERALSSAVDENQAKWHWIFLAGALTLHEDLSSQASATLLDKRKALVAQHVRTLTFLAQELDRSLATDQYEDFVKRLYTMVSERYLYRKVKERPGQSAAP